MRCDGALYHRGRKFSHDVERLLKKMDKKSKPENSRLARTHTSVRGYAGTRPREDAPERTRETPPFVKKPRVAGKPIPTKPKPDPLREIIFERKHPDAVLGKVRDAEGVQIIPLGKVADCPLEYLYARQPEHRRLTDEQYLAAVRYREDLRALARTGSNTSAIIDHMRMAPNKVTKEDRHMIAQGIPFMKANEAHVGGADPSDRMLATAFRVSRFEKRLDPVDAAVLNDLLIHERSVAQIGARWSWQPEAASAMVRRALWSLTALSMVLDAEYQATVAAMRMSTDNCD